MCVTVPSAGAMINPSSCGGFLSGSLKKLNKNINKNAGMGITHGKNTIVNPKPIATGTPKIINSLKPYLVSETNIIKIKIIFIKLNLNEIYQKSHPFP
jgi:hypothetical protein